MANSTIKIEADEKSVRLLKVLAERMALCFLSISVQFEEMKKALDAYERAVNESEK